MPPDNENKKIVVVAEGNVTDTVKFADELRRIIEYIEVNLHLQVG